MPSARRLPRTVRPSISPAVIPINSNDPSGGNRYSPLGPSVPTLPGVEQPPAPKHIPFPNTSMESELFFEFLVFIFACVSAGLQFLHLYRSVWWLPHSYTKQTVNFYLIDKYLVIFIVFLFSRRLSYLVLCNFFQVVFLKMYIGWTTFCIRISMLILMVGILCNSKAVHDHVIVNIFYLCYPICVYLILFGFNMMPFFQLNNSENIHPLHACSSNTSEIRTEVENLKANFNEKIKQILFSSVLTAYYTGFIPCVFVQNFLYYDVYWVSQHVLFVWMGSFTCYFSYMLPLRYYDTLHRSSMHLGCWEKLESRSHVPVAYCWQDDMLWPYGALVRYGKDVYRAQGESNAAEPGNSTYARFYGFFRNPAIVLSGVLGLHVSLVIIQLAALIKSTYWYCIVSVTILMFFNYFTLFKIARDYIICIKIYRAELIVLNKINGNN